MPQPIQLKEVNQTFSFEIAVSSVVLTIVQVDDKQYENYNFLERYIIVVQRLHDDVKALIATELSLTYPDHCPCPLTEQQCGA